MEGITKTLLPSAGWNVSPDGSPIPKSIPEGSTIIKTTNKNFTYETPDGQVITADDSSLRNMYYNYNTAMRYGEVNYEYKNQAGEIVNQDGTPISNPSTSVDPTGSTTPTTTPTTTTGSGVNPGSTSVDNTTDVPNASLPTVDDSALRNSAEFKALSEDQQQAVLQVYQAIAANDTDNAERLAAAFKTSAAISDPFFKQELRLAVDAIERGFVSIDQEEEYKARQLQQNQQELEQDLQTKKDYLNFEEQAALRQIGRQYGEDLKAVRQSMAATGKTFSSERAETEGLLEESTGDLRESTQRKFGIQQTEIQQTGERASRTTQQELDRLTELSKDKRISLLREAEAQVGTKNLPDLNTNLSPLGDIVGDIPQRQTSDIISGAQNLLF